MQNQVTNVKKYQSAREYALASYYTIAMAEASSNLARFDNIRYGFDFNPDGYEWNTYFAKVQTILVTRSKGE